MAHATSAEPRCVFCAIVARQAEASVVFEDDTVVAFMDVICDGEVAFQTVFHIHLHVIPRYTGDNWNIIPDPAERERSLLDQDAEAIKDGLLSAR